MMTKDGNERSTDHARDSVARRAATADGAILGDASENWFEPAFWAARGELVPTAGGRGSAWFIAAAGPWVLRHYRRGGFIARLSRDRYVWLGEARVRAFAEWRMLARLRADGLPVPAPLGARYQRRGMFYRCDLITLRVHGARPLSALLALEPLQRDGWRAVGAALRRLHAAGADHADLNAHNILLDEAGTVTVIDFDRGRLRDPGGWAAANLARLRRSLRKVTRELPPGRFSAAAWDQLLAGYAAT